MGDVINLRQQRKRKKRAENERLSEENRVIHGRTKIEKNAIKEIQKQNDKHLDGHRLQGDE